MNGRNLNQVLSESLRNKPELLPQQRGALQDISYGTLRFYGQLTAVLDQLLSKPLKDTSIRNLLLVALYQLQYSKSAPYAVVDFAVKTARKINPATSGLVNAVLRNFLRQQNLLLEKANKTEEGRLSYPQWWINEIKRQYQEKAEAILLAGNQHPPMTLRVNCKMMSAAEYLSLLVDGGIHATKIEPEAILLEQPLNVEKIPGFFEGLVSVQDAGAQYAAKFLDVKDGMHVLDACSAPGGKTAHLLELADLDLLALDKDELRIERVKENLQRLKLSAAAKTGDASLPAKWWDGRQFQRILADVPCSATGVVRRHPDIKWLRRGSDIESFAQQQTKILMALWPLLEAGGKLLYATCSIFERENQQVINEFLGQNIDAKQLSLSAPDMIQGQILPNNQHDGFFYALLQKQQ
jgi:16S rRNA (cytosine967-C5)-methyltransferase